MATTNATFQPHPRSLVWLLVVTYTAPLERIDSLLPAHVRHLDRFYASGELLASGPRSPRHGGVIIAHAPGRDHLDGIVAADPFVQAGVATYSTVAFTPTRGPLAAALLGAPLDPTDQMATAHISRTNDPPRAPARSKQPTRTGERA
jgi:uncharacterized protein YciI